VWVSPPEGKFACCGCVQVIGSMAAGWEDDDSTGNDDDSAGVLSHGGSTDSDVGNAAGRGRPGGMGAFAGEDSLEGEGSRSIIASEDSGF
jgi:hypothetical protein